MPKEKEKTYLFIYMPQTDEVFVTQRRTAKWIRQYVSEYGKEDILIVDGDVVNYSSLK